MTGNGTKNIKSIAKILLVMAAPKVAKALKTGFFDEEIISFFVDVVKKTVAHRKSTGIE